MIVPAIIVDAGTLFEKEIHPDTGLEVIGMETYFVPEVKMQNGTYFDITYPAEIVLPGLKSNLTQNETT